MKLGHILLVEDNPDDERLTLRALKEHNVTNPVEVALDGQQAIDVLFDPARALPALVLLDLRLPKVGGLEVLRRLRADPARKLVPVVILTSSQEESDLVQGYSFGANSYIRKPVDFKQFSSAVSHLSMYWLLLNEPPPIVTLKAA